MKSTASRKGLGCAGDGRNPTGETKKLVETPLETPLLEVKVGDQAVRYAETVYYNETGCNPLAQKTHISTLY